MASIYESLCRPWEWDAFDTFSPMEGEVPSAPFESLPSIAKRARSMLSNISEIGVIATAMYIDEELNDFYEHVGREIAKQFPMQSSGAQNFVCTNDWQESAGWLQSINLIQTTNISDLKRMPARGDISDFELLKALGESIYSLSMPEDFQLHHFFAVLALRYVDECIKTVGKFSVHQALDISDTPEEISFRQSKGAVLGEGLLVLASQPMAYALDSICYAEHLQELYRIGHQHLSKPKTLVKFFEEMAPKVRSENAKKGADKKNEPHKKNNAIVNKWYKGNGNLYKSVDAAAEAASMKFDIKFTTARRYIQEAREELKAQKK